MEYKRNCPKCGVELSYTDGGNFSRAKKRNSVCVNCRKMPDSLKKTLSEYWTGKKRPSYKRKPKNMQEKKYTRKCPGCDCDLYYTTKYNYEQAIKKSAVCTKCSANNRITAIGKSFILTQDQINKRSANRAGYETFDEYMEKLPEFKKYKRQVMSITYKQPLTTLENYEKTGMMGTEGAFNCDHIISIYKGFTTGIAPEVIGNIKNLRMIPWLENIKKHKN